jgi:hypothetical protein
MSQIVVYRQCWMVTLKDRHCCQICGDLALTAPEFVDKNGTCESVSWFCVRDIPSLAEIEEQK